MVGSCSRTAVSNSSSRSNSWRSTTTWCSSPARVVNRRCTTNCRSLLTSELVCDSMSLCMAALFTVSVLASGGLSLEPKWLRKKKGLHAGRATSVMSATAGATSAKEVGPVSCTCAGVVATDLPGPHTPTKEDAPTKELYLHETEDQAGSVNADLTHLAEQRAMQMVHRYQKNTISRDRCQHKCRSCRVTRGPAPGGASSQLVR